jgi:hypothetical protein
MNETKQFDIGIVGIIALYLIMPLIECWLRN